MSENNNKQAYIDLVKSDLRQVGFKVVLGFSLAIILVIFAASPANIFLAFYFPVTWSVLSVIAITQKRFAELCAKVWVVLSVPVAVALVIENGLVPAPLIPLASVIPIILLSGAWRVIPVVFIVGTTFLIPFANAGFVNEGVQYATWLRLCLANTVVACLVFIFARSLENTLAESMAKTAELNASLSRERAAREVESSFVATMSHEIRTPLNGIVGLVDAVARTPLTTEQQKLLESVQRSGKALQNILDDILNYSKLSAGHLTLEYQSTSIKRVVQDTVELFTPPANLKSLKLVYDIDPRLSDSLLCDDTRLSQVLSNLVSNAIKFSEMGEVNISVQILRETDVEQSILFTIKDQGIGVAANKIEQIFEPFKQADTAVSRRYGGTGLGLKISKELIEKMGGRIWLESEQEKGCEFFVELTLQKTKEAATNEQKSDEVNFDDLSGRILVVDDNDINLTVIRALLASSTLQVIVTNNGRDAIKANQKHNFDLILMDISMPGFDGMQTTQEIRQHDQDTPIVAFSAAVLEDEVKQAINAGMNDFLAKPINKQRMREVLLQYLAST